MIVPFLKDKFSGTDKAGQYETTAGIILQATFFFWIITKITCWRLWTTERLLPTAPPFDFLVAPSWVHLLLLSISLLLMLLLIFKPMSKPLLVALFASELLTCLLDQSRWQPWEYQFIFIVLIAIVYNGQFQKILTAYVLVVIATYTYSGLGKFNTAFLLLFWDNLLLGNYLKIDPATIQQPLLHYSGYLVALAELLFGIGLFFSKTKKIAAWAIIAMHIFILVMVGPFGLRYNSSVWPWNVLMITHVYFLFIRNVPIPLSFQSAWAGWNKLVLLCWWILPLLNHSVGLWDNFLSLRLFAGNQVMMVLCITDRNEINELKPYIEKDMRNVCDGDRIVNIQKWSMREMNAPAYTELRVYRKIAAKWIQSHPGTSTKAVAYFYTENNGVQLVP